MTTLSPTYLLTYLLTSVAVVLVVGGGDASVASNSDLVSNTSTTAIAAAAAAADSSDDTAAGAVESDAVKPTGDEQSAVRADTGHGSSVAVGLRTGHFDTDNVKLLRTCSEPDLGRVCRQSSSNTTGRSSVHHSREGSLTDVSPRHSIIADLVSQAVHRLLTATQCCTSHCCQ